jgi:hypothetical protein
MVNKDKTKEWIVGKSAYQVFLSIKERLKDLSSDDQREIWAIYKEVNEPTTTERKQIMDRLF